jgi:hypothetical protein
MNHNEAMNVAKLFRATGLFSEVKVQHHGFYSDLTEEAMQDGQWRVELWSVNARAGNRTLTTVRSKPADAAEYATIAATATGKASARDAAAVRRIVAETEVDSE